MTRASRCIFVDTPKGCTFDVGSSCTATPATLLACVFSHRSLVIEKGMKATLRALFRGELESLKRTQVTQGKGIRLRG